MNAGKEGDWAAHISNRLERLIHYNHRAQALEPREIAKAAARIQTLLSSCAPEVRPALTHRDLCLKNVLLSPTATFAALLDFEHARMSDPLMDFVKLRLWLFEREPGSEAAFLAGYRAERPKPWPHENERYEIALLLELLGEIPYYKRNSAQAELDLAVNRLRAGLA